MPRLFAADPNPARTRRWAPDLKAVLSACVLAALPLRAPASTKHVTSALVIGNARYTSVVPLATPASDARQVCAALRSIGFKTTCLTDVATRADLRAAIQDYVDSLPDGAVSFIYYAGHGLQVNGENYLVPTDAQLPDEAAVPGQTVSLSFLMRQLRRKSAYLRIIILDACRNNPLATAGRPLPPGLAKITDLPDATEVLYATADNGVAIDDLGGNGILTRQLLAHLHDEGTVDTLFKKVELGVQTDTVDFLHPQRPAVYTNFTGQYCLVRCTAVDRLQRQQLDADRQIAQLSARVSQGDEQARSQLAAARTAYQKLVRQIQQQEDDRRRKAYVIPAN